MSTRAFSYIDEPWSHDWEYEVVDHFGDADTGGPHYGVVVSIRAESPEQAEQRALTYLVANFDDRVDGSVTAADTGAAPGWRGEHLVRIVWTR